MSSPSASAPSSSLSPKKRRLWPWLLSIAVIGGGAWYATHRPAPDAGPEGKQANGARGGPNGRGDRPTPVTLAEIKPGDIRVTLPALGNVVPRNQVTVRSRVDGQLLALKFTEGQPVKAGELLAQIDPEPFKATLEQARG
ncbi:biotin/lipoyl-binding protein, partial [Zoogloea sp.]|uniref:biotin/lipoyl-binding protein n=1 Tax=Zoogloea sp. TaxID=49181 RepID=UPI0025865BB6